MTDFAKKFIVCFVTALVAWILLSILHGCSEDPQIFYGETDAGSREDRTEIVLWSDTDADTDTDTDTDADTNTDTDTDTDAVCPTTESGYVCVETAACSSMAYGTFDVEHSCEDGLSCCYAIPVLEEPLPCPESLGLAKCIPESSLACAQAGGHRNDRYECTTLDGEFCCDYTETQ